MTKTIPWCVLLQMVPVAAQAGPSHADLWLDTYSLNALTRVAGGRGVARALPRRLVVDVREFRSSLPAVLHQQGFLLAPMTLEVRAACKALGCRCF